ncbi:eCIS core domain-containing protein [Jatrophihabitans sp. DSM 45814]
MAGPDFASLLRVREQAFKAVDRHPEPTLDDLEIARREPAGSVAATVGAPATLVVGNADDRAEHDADRVADSVLARLNSDMPDRHQHGPSCGHGGAGSEGLAAMADPVRRRPAAGSSTERPSVAESSAAPVVGRAGGALSGDLSGEIDRARSGGSALDSDVRQRMEAGFGGSLADVRIHTDSQAARLSRTVAARAFTTGSDIFFGAGEYQPDTPEGERVLAHELAHTRQQGPVSRKMISRLWDLKANGPIPWNQAVGIRTLASRPIWFIADSAGNEIVVKPENQPVGLGSLVGLMQHKVSQIKSVDQRTLTGSDRLAIDNTIGIDGWTTNDPSWAKRGDFLKAQPKSKIAPTEDSAEAARDDAAARLGDRKTNVIAMSVAKGEDAMSAATPNATADKMSSGKSRLRGLLEDKEHMRSLGRLNMVDLFMGNKDRIASGNLGNWFYDPTGEITLIDHVDPGDNESAEMTRGMVDNNVWISTVGRNSLTPKRRIDAATGGVGKIIQTAARDDDDGGAGDGGITAWSQQVINGTKRRDAMNAAMLEGIEESRRQIIKIFSTSKWDLGKGSAHATKKKLRSAAKKSTAVDVGDNAYGGNDPTSYYAILKARVAWLKAN